MKSRVSFSIPRNVSIGEKKIGNTSSSSSDKQENDNASQNSNELQQNESDNFGNVRIDSSVSRSSHITSIELQTYKPLIPLLPAEVDHVEETPPASIFVIEVDVNHVESVHEKLGEELTENKDKG